MLNIIMKKGFKHTEETKRKMKECKIGENNPFYGKHHTEEWKQKRSGKNNFNYGKHPSEETKQKRRENNKNNPNMGMKNKSHSEETKQKMKEIKLGKPRSEETKQKIKDNHVGMKNKSHSEETKQKIREGNLGKIISEETRQKMRGKTPSHLVSRGKSSYYNSPLQDKVWLRSSYELKFAQYLDENNISWLYEIQTFDLGNTTYTPDFYLPTCDMFIEIKGYMTDKAQEKINKFLDIYHDITLVILKKDNLVKLGIEL